MFARRAQFIYLSVEAFRKLTPQQKQEYVQALKDHLDVPNRAVASDQPRFAEH